MAHAPEVDSEIDSELDDEDGERRARELLICYWLSRAGCSAVLCWRLLRCTAAACAGCRLAVLQELRFAVLTIRAPFSCPLLRLGRGEPERRLDR